MTDAFNGFHIGWIVVPVAGVALLAIARDRHNNRKEERVAQKQAWAEHRAAAAAGLVPPYAGAPINPATATTWTEPTTVLPEYAAAPPMPPAPPAPPAWQPPLPAYVPPRPKRTGVLWFWPTLAMIAIALGIVGLVDANHHVDGGVYPATALAITGVMLVVGSFVGRPGGLILVGIVSSLALSVSSVVGGFDFSGNDRTVVPKTAADVQSSYTGTNGRLVLDLTEVTDPQNLAGRTIKLTLKAGEIQVILPRTVNASVDAEFAFAGGIDVPGYSGGGIQDSVRRQLVGSKAGNTSPLDLDLHAAVGHIEVLVDQP